MDVQSQLSEEPADARISMTTRKRKEPEAECVPVPLSRPPPGHFDCCIIGSGVSTGVPMMNHILQGACPNKEYGYRKSDGMAVCVDACRPDSKNARSNVSILVRFTPSGGETGSESYVVMVDAGKTMRPACMRALPRLGVSTVDALLLTHDHADAIFGLDDLRDLQQQSEVTDPETGKLW